jgi:CHAT domain-containing protein
MYDRNGEPIEGFLRLHDIYSLNLPAKLVVLSACETSLGREFKGEGLVGLVRGFMYAGARGVISSLWKVDDFATKELMTIFYREMFMNSESPASALRKAQVEIWKGSEFRDPFYWAAFNLQGDWISREKSK